MKIDFSGRSLIDHIRTRLTGRAHATLASGPVEAAVLIPLYIKDGEYHILFTKRTAHLNHHGGEISFPGGVRHSSDADMLSTALRETEEEVGIAPRDVEVLGRIDDIISIYDYRVEPYVGSIPEGYSFVPNPDEIDRLIEIPVSHLIDPAHFRAEQWEFRSRPRPVYFFEYGDDIVWGLTAAMLKQFLTVTLDARL